LLSLTHRQSKPTLPQSEQKVPMRQRSCSLSANFGTYHGPRNSNADIPPLFSRESYHPPSSDRCHEGSSACPACRIGAGRGGSQRKQRVIAALNLVAGP